MKYKSISSIAFTTILLFQIISLISYDGTFDTLSVYAQSEEFSQFENTDMGIKVTYPSTWIIESIDSSVAFYSPLENNLDQFSENVSITLEYLGEPISLQEYSDFSTEQLKLVGYEILESKSSTLSKNPA